ncbi:MAG TPA: hypothetical protein VEQ42_10575, partial [Pyrinomonadaceae bacterium]|nr:hypothetical protein [Pyrinomonadaceae bacterium]
MRLADHQVLAAARDVVAEAGDGRERRAGEGLEVAAVAEAVAEDERGVVVEAVVDAGLEVVVVVELRRRGDEVGEGDGAVRQGV